MYGTACQRVLADFLHFSQHALNRPQHKPLGILIEDNHCKAQGKRDKQGPHYVEDAIQLGVPVCIEDSCADIALGIVLQKKSLQISSPSMTLKGLQCVCILRISFSCLKIVSGQCYLSWAAKIRLKIKF